LSRTVNRKPEKHLGLSPELWDRLTEAAKGFGFPTKVLGNRLLEEALDNLVSPSEFRLTRPPINPKEGFEVGRE
jgi:hypothetical protein